MIGDPCTRTCITGFKPRHTTSRPLVKIKIVRMSNEKDMKELSKLLGGMNMPPGALALNFAVWTGRKEQDDASSNSFPHSSGRRLRTPF